VHPLLFNAPSLLDDSVEWEKYLDDLKYLPQDNEEVLEAIAEAEEILRVRKIN